MHRKNNGDPILRSNPRYLFAFPLSGVLSRIALPPSGLPLSRIVLPSSFAYPAPLLTFFLSYSPDRPRAPFSLLCSPGCLRAPSLPYVTLRAVLASRLFLMYFSGPTSHPVSSLCNSPGRLRAPSLPYVFLRAALAFRLFFNVSSGPPPRTIFSFAPAAAESAMYVCGPVSTIINPAPPVNAHPRFSSHSQRARPRLPAQKRIYFCHFE